MGLDSFPFFTSILRANACDLTRFPVALTWRSRCSSGTARVSLDRVPRVGGGITGQQKLCHYTTFHQRALAKRKFRSAAATS